MDQGVEAIEIADGRDPGQDLFIRSAQLPSAQAEQDQPRLFDLPFGLALGPALGLALGPALASPLPKMSW